MQKIDLNKDPLGMGKVIQKLGVNIFTALVKAGRAATDDIAGQGRLRAPIDRGDLRRSIYRDGDYSINEAEGGHIEFRVRADAAYASVQHEVTSFVHPKGGEDHFLTKPAKERKSAHMQRIQQAVIRAMRQTGAE